VSSIELRGVAKRLGVVPVLTNVHLTVPDGSITAVLGASGSGKTTLLRLVAGFEQADHGTVTIGDRIVDDGYRYLRTQHRCVGYVPQEGALFPHLTVLGNISFGVGRRQRSRVTELIELVGLSGLARRFPHQLSGGQQQRVALARALAIRPEIVLLDEPFSSLDASLRVGLRNEITHVLSQTGTTTILVTHDRDEALSLADQIAILRDGQVVACADPRELYHDPPDAATATVVGEANIVTAHTRANQAHCALGTVRLRTAKLPGPDGRCQLLLRPEQLALHPRAKAGTTQATVVELHYHGHDMLAHIRLNHPDHDILLARVPGDLALAPGQPAWVEVIGAGRAWPSTESTV
jgi:iron(III) transport system ATP-binding protein